MNDTNIIRLSEFQKEVALDKSRFKVVKAGRRTGKTFVSPILINDVLLSGANKNAIYITSTYMQAKKNFFNVYLKMTPPQLIKKVYQSSPQSIELINGSKVTLYGANNYDAIRGEGFDIAILDEVADIPEEAWYEVIRPALSDRQGKAVFIGTPKGTGNWFYDLFNIEEYAQFEITTADGGMVKISEIDEAKKHLDSRTFAQEYLASFENAQGLVAYNYSSDNYLFETYKSNRKTVLCWDFNINPASCIINQEISLDKWCFVKEFSIANTSTQTMIEILQEYFKENGYPVHLEITGDYSGKQRRSSAGAYTDWILIEQAFGVKAKISMNRIKDRVNAFTSTLKSSKDIIKQYINKDNCKVLHNDLIRLTWAENGKDLDSQNGKIGHMFDAATYFAVNYYPIRKEVKGYVA